MSGILLYKPSSRRLVIFTCPVLVTLLTQLSLVHLVKLSEPLIVFFLTG